MPQSTEIGSLQDSVPAYETRINAASHKKSINDCRRTNNSKERMKEISHVLEFFVFQVLNAAFFYHF